MESIINFINIFEEKEKVGASDSPQSPDEEHKFAIEPFS